MARVAVLSACLVVPCFWQALIQAGDLGNLAADGKLSGITVVPQFTNVRFDLAVSRLLRTTGGQAERLAVSAAAGRRPWFLAPVLAMLAYGWVFRAGFFSFYLGLGFGFAAPALLVRRVSPRRPAAAAGLLALAVLAHVLAAIWAAGTCIYIALGHPLNRRHRWMLAGIAVAALFWVRLFCSAALDSRRTPLQLASLTGAEQLWLYSSRHYALPTLGLVLVRTLLAARRLEEPPAARDGAAMLAPLVLVAFSFLACRISLAAAALITAAVAGVRPTRFEMTLVGAIAAAFFAVSYFDTRQLNQIEDRIGAAARTVPSGRRVLNGPSSKQFRVRAAEENPFVLSTRRAVSEVETGRYRVAARDLPVYVLESRGPAGQVGLRSLRAGELAGRTCSARPGK